MRKEPFSTDSYVHVFKRGVRKSPIVRDDSDRWRFLRLLHYLNDENVPRNWERELTVEESFAFVRPDAWPEAKPYVSVVAYCLLDNHFHLLLRERNEGGIPKFMQRLGTSMSAYFNAKYEESGTLFQGAYRSRTVHTDQQLQYLAAYIQIKNTLEMYPGGLSNATLDLERALSWAETYPFSSYNDYIDKCPRSFILDMSLVRELFETGGAFKAFSKDVLRGRNSALEHIRELILDEEDI